MLQRCPGSPFPQSCAGAVSLPSPPSPPFYRRVGQTYRAEERALPSPGCFSGLDERCSFAAGGVASSSASLRGWGPI